MTCNNNVLLPLNLYPVNITGQLSRAFWCIISGNSLFFGFIRILQYPLHASLGIEGGKSLKTLSIGIEKKLFVLIERGSRRKVEGF